MDCQQASKHLKVIWCMLETFCFGGITFGWASLVYVFKQEGFFADECQANNETKEMQREPTCDNQDAKLVLIYSLGNGLAIIPLFLCGNVLSRFGARTTRAIWICIFMAGCIFMIISSPALPWFACVGLACLSGGGRVFLQTSMQISSLYKTGSFMVILLINGSFDSSSAMTLFVKIAYEAGVSRRVSFIVILSLCITTFASTFKIFKEKRPIEPVENDERTNCDEGKIGVKAIYRKYICSKMFISHGIWSFLLAIHFSFLIAASNIYITHVGDNNAERESTLTNFLSVTLFCGMIPAIGAGILIEIVRKKKTGNVFVKDLKTSTVGVVITTVLSVALSVLFIFQEMPVVYTAFIVLPVFRTFLFSMAYSFISKAYPGEAFGSLAAVIDCLISTTLFIQRALIAWLQAYTDGALHIRMTFLGLSLAALFHPLLLFIRIRSISKQSVAQNDSKGKGHKGDTYDTMTVDDYGDHIEEQSMTFGTREERL